MRGESETMKTVVVTGGIGSGKCEFCRLLVQKGIPVYDSDLRAKSVYDEEPGLVDDMDDSLGCSLRADD